MPDSDQNHVDPNGGIASPNGDGQGPERRHVGFSARLQAAAKVKGLSAPDLARKHDLSRGTFGRYWNGERLPPGDLLFALADEVGEDPRYLVTGTRSDALTDRQRPLKGLPADDDIVEVGQLDPRFGLGSLYLDANPEVTTHRFSRTWLRQWTHTDPALLFWMPGKGNSMSPDIDDGDVVLVDRGDKTPKDADLIWCFAWGEIGTIKWLRPLPDGNVRIISSNTNLPPETVWHEEIHIVGRVIAVVKNL